MESSDKREQIIAFLRKNGPSLPVQVAKAVQISSLFAGAYLSELYKERTVFISHIKIGNSPLYFLSEHIPLLENFSKHLKEKEKDAFLLLKKQGVLKDSKQTPVIRVALRSIKDFAIPIKIGEEIFWKYFTITNQEQVMEIIEKNEKFEFPKPAQIKKPAVKEEQSNQQEKQKKQEGQQLKLEEISVKPAQVQVKQQAIAPKAKPEVTAEQLKEIAEREIGQEIKKEQEEKKAEIEIEESEKETEESKEEEGFFAPIKALISGRKTGQKRIEAKEKFLQQIRGYLSQKNIELLELQKLDKKQLIAIIKKAEEKYLLVAFNKSKFDEDDLIKIHRKHPDTEIPFYFLSKSEITKKTEEIIRAAKRVKAVGFFELKEG